MLMYSALFFCSQCIRLNASLLPTYILSATNGRLTRLHFHPPVTQKAPAVFCFLGVDHLL
jgi:hypothetical protein